MRIAFFAFPIGEIGGFFRLFFRFVCFQSRVSFGGEIGFVSAFVQSKALIFDFCDLSRNGFDEIAIVRYD